MRYEKILEVDRTVVQNYQQMANSTIAHPNLRDSWAIRFSNYIVAYWDVWTEHIPMTAHFRMTLQDGADYAVVGEKEMKFVGEHTLTYKGDEYCIKVVAI